MQSSSDQQELAELLDAYIATKLAELPPEQRPLWSYTDPELLAEASRAQQTVDTAKAHHLQILAEAEQREATRRLKSLSTAGWLVDNTTHSPRTARDDVRLAVGLAQTPLVAVALSAGRVSAEQAGAILNGLRRLPEDFNNTQRDAVVEQLVGFAADFDPSHLSRLVNRAIEVVAPEVAEEADQKAVERLDAQQRRDRYVTWRQDPDGSWVFRGKLPTLQGQQLVNLLRSISAKHRATVLLAGGTIERTQAAADALGMLTDHYLSCGQAPMFGADRPRVTVTIDYDVLVGKLGTATLLDNDVQLTAQQARRLACDAEILPVVLGGKSVALDVGRSKRLFAGKLRQAIITRDGGCTFPGCDRPPAECEAHHRKPWWAGGKTRLKDGVLLCTYHHHQIEPDPNKPPDAQWLIRLDPKGRSEFSPPLQPGQSVRVWKQHARFRR